MSIDLPPTEKALARKVVVVLDTAPAASTGIPTRTEVNAALFSALHLYTPFNVVPTQNSGEGPRKLGSRSVPTQGGLTNYPAVPVKYSYKPQLTGAPGGIGNELFDVCQEDDIRTVVVFNGLDGDIDVIPNNAVGHIYLMKCGAQIETETGESEFDDFAIEQSWFVVGGQPIKKHHIFTP
jgi:hypothetical protein